MDPHQPTNENSSRWSEIEVNRIFAMSEYDAYLSLIVMLGLLVSSPFFYRLCFFLGKLFIVNFFPPKHITLEIKMLDGKTVRTKVSLEDNDALVRALLNSTGRRS